jgi:hypothetical protein
MSARKFVVLMIGSPNRCWNWDQVFRRKAKFTRFAKSVLPKNHAERKVSRLEKRADCKPARIRKGVARAPPFSFRVPSPS